MSLFAPQSETRAAVEQRARDEAALPRQLAYLREHSPFYRDKLGDAEAGGLDDLAALPFTTKDEIRASLATEPPLGRHLAAPPESVRRIYSTSGTTGDPSYIAVTDADLAGWTEIGARSYRATGIAPGRRAVLTYNSGPFVAGAVLEAWSRIGAGVIPVGSGNTERLVRAFQGLGAEMLGCTPSYAIYLVDWCRARDIDPASLGIRHLAVAGEPGGGEPATRALIEQAFGATVREAMGIADVSPSLWGECEEQAGMHFCGRDFVHVELIDPADAAPLAWEDGAEGELVYTSLRREAMPVLRFRSRDRVVVTARPCSCGRRPADRPRDQSLPQCGARGRRRVPPARRRPDPDPARPHRRAAGRPAAGDRRAGGGRARRRRAVRCDPGGDPRQARHQHGGRARALRHAAPQRVQEPAGGLLGVRGALTNVNGGWVGVGSECRGDHCPA
jgi:phenylacetate-CoA ligase